MTDKINWSKQCCGVHQATAYAMTYHMPDLKELIKTFPEDPEDFIWDVKVHMLMPNQYPCIPNWHFDNIPRVNNAQDFSKIKPDAPMYLWISGEPATEFKMNDGTVKFVPHKTWFRFTQKDEHRGTMSKDFQWRGFVRATHKDITPAIRVGSDCIRRHSQVYLDAANFRW